MTTGEKIKTARKKAGLTQRELGGKIGVSYQTLAQWENDLRKPKPETLQRIASALELKWYDLLPDDQKDAGIAADIIKGAGLTIKDKDGNIIHQEDAGESFVKVFPSLTSKERIDAALDQLNDMGQQKAVERVEELTEIPKYQRQPPQDAPAAPTEGMDTHSTEKPTEGK